MIGLSFFIVIINVCWYCGRYIPAHTEASAKGLAEVIRMVQPDGVLAFLVAMASDKDHLAFARQLLSGTVGSFLKF